MYRTKICFFNHLVNAMFAQAASEGHKAFRIERFDTLQRSQTILRCHAPRSPDTPISKEQCVHIAYYTSWKNPQIHYSVSGSAWSTLSLARPVVSAGDSWAFARIELEAEAIASDDRTDEHAEIRFALTDGYGTWDKAPDGSDYRILASGKKEGVRFMLRHGAIAQIPMSMPGILLVSDLDDTLVGDHEGLTAFVGKWRSECVPAGGRLVYNTGRSLISFLKLFHAQEGRLPIPDVLICSVGTRIYYLSTSMDGNNGTSSGSLTESSWREDEAWTAHLGTSSWNVDIVSDAAEKAIFTIGPDRMHLRPPEETNEHKVTLGVRADALQFAVSCIEDSLQSQSEFDAFAHKFIVSGEGEWRFIDIVPLYAGKLQALEYVRRKLGFDHANTIACGDSGNDLDMLDGNHHAIVVGNAHEELRRWALDSVKDDERSRSLLMVEKHRAFGILEGLQSLGFLS